MSAGAAIQAAEARAAAEDLVRALWPACERVEIAGSLRRGKPEVHDIEIVAVPKTETRPDGLFGEVQGDLLEDCVAHLLAHERVGARAVENRRTDGTIDVQTKLGPAFKALVYLGIPVDLFIVRPPAQWGVIFALRTGPGDWNIELVTRCKEIGRRVAGGQVERWVSASSSWAPVPTPEEADFFAAIGQAWVAPPDRHVDRVHISRAFATTVGGR
jgi:DNA polymerase/3'-5' exonuclease PolX